MYADLNCTCFCTKQMLTADASVFGVYKCLCSLLNVLVLLLLEIDLKRVYLFHTGAFGPTRDECFQSSPGKHCCVLRYVFCCGTMSCQNEQFHWGVLPFRRRLNVKRKQRKSKRSVWINWDRNNFFFFFCQTKLLYLHGLWLPTWGSLVRFAFHEVAIVVCQMYAENTDQYGYNYNHRLAMHGVVAVEENGNLVGCFSRFVSCLLTKVLHNSVSKHPTTVPTFSMKDENKTSIISVRVGLCSTSIYSHFSVSTLRNVHILMHTSTHWANLCPHLQFCVWSDAFLLGGSHFDPTF